MKAYERIIEQELPPLNSSVLWMDISVCPAVLRHFKDGKWRAMTELDLHELAKQGDNPNATLTEVLEACKHSYETATEGMVKSMWGLAFITYMDAYGYLINISIDSSGYLIPEGCDFLDDGYIEIYNN